MNHTILSLDRVDSTNGEVKRKRKEPEGLVVVAEEQTAGRGRGGRNWYSAHGEGLYFTCLLKPAMTPKEAAGITLLAGVSVRDAMEKVTGLVPKIKWPNDLLLSGRKVCGILLELFMEPQEETALAVGVGINVNQKTFPKESCPYATSLFLETGKRWKKESLLETFLEAFDGYYETFSREKNLEFLKETYEASLIQKGKKVQVMDPAGAWEGTALGIEENGRLMVQRADGSIHPVEHGEVSVRGVYGYAE